MKREIQRIGIFSAVKAGFLIGGIGGILLGLFNAAVIMSIASGLAEAGLDPSYYAEEVGNVLNVGFGALAFLSPVFGGMLGVIVGVIVGFVGAGVYNVGARLWGGVEIELGERRVKPDRPKDRPKTTSSQPTPLPTATPPSPSSPQPPGPSDYGEASSSEDVE